MRLKENFSILLVAVLIVVAGGLWFGPGLFSTEAPDIHMRTLQGNEFSLSELRGKPVLITFWATTCPGCIKEQPHLVELYKKYGSQGLTIIGVAMTYDPLEQVRKLVQQRDLPYLITHDTNGRIAEEFGKVKLTPTSFLIDPNGKIRYKKIGEMNMSLVEKEINQMLTRG